ncbi:AAA family ATPase [uncultured Marivirga sp.]|uniref:AAA family ATPase n=1 Tax=uncultured Marivirga sp. TaxID=1123707 RepID=UPI0030EF16BF|tara:strand:- start:11007 stop:13373 length:2367 start_codon:yes stop_codon:yes gene_type:complete
MPFNPEQITQDHILKAVDRIERDSIDLKVATKYKVIINDKPYPPQELMSYAHGEMNGEHIWEYPGGKKTNKYLHKFGYEIFYKGMEIPNENINRRIFYWLYAPGPNAVKWDQFYKEGIMALGWDDLGDLSQYESKEEIAETLRKLTGEDGSKKNDATANYQFSANCHLRIGDVIIPKKGKSEYLGYGLVTSDYIYDEDRSQYKSFRKVNWIKKGVWKEDVHPIVTKTLTDISKYPGYVNRLISLIGIEEAKTVKMNNENTIVGLNNILYGPPGTGKTYFLNQLKANYTDKAVKKSKNEVLKEIAEKHPWWKLIAAVLYILGDSKVPQLVEQPVLLSKHNPDTPTKANQIVWGQLQSHSDNTNYSNKQEPIIFSKAEGSIWSVNKELIEQELTDIKDIVDEIENADKKHDKEEKEVERFNFVTFHQSFTYEDFVEGIKPKLSNSDSELSDSSDLGYIIEKGIFYRACVESLKLAGYNSFTECHHDSKANRKGKFNNAKPYALFIDEINRGNISAIFGELITLIEGDKRIGGDQEIWTSLPYDKSIKFSVPPNLHLIGTMNTADRSVEALDTALRRRFTFTEIAPNTDLLTSDRMLWMLWEMKSELAWEDEEWVNPENELLNILGGKKIDTEAYHKLEDADWEQGYSKNIFEGIVSFQNGILFDVLLKTINDRIELLIDKDHRIGHSYFLTMVGAEDTVQELQNIFYNKVIPLLEEYFYGDFGKIGLVLGDQFVKKSQGHKVSFGKFEHEDQHLYKEKHLYEIIDYRNGNADAFLSAVKSIYYSNPSENE